MYKNIIFDFGGVVVQFNPKDFLMDHFMNKRAEEIVYELTFGSQEWQDLDRGTITREEGNAAMLENAARVNRVFEVQTVIDEWPTILRTKESTVHTMQKLKAAGYRLYYLTNIPADIMDELRQREWFSLFDGGVASCEVHLCKPEPAICAVSSGVTVFSTVIFAPISIILSSFLSRAGGTAVSVKYPAPSRDRCTASACRRGGWYTARSGPARHRERP